MRKLIASLTIIGALLPSLASAKDTIKLGNVLVPAGFCSIAQDGTRGVRLTGEGYKAWISQNALDKSVLNQRVRDWNVERAKQGLLPMTPLEEETYRAGQQANQARLWYGHVTSGQNALCK